MQPHAQSWLRVVFPPPGFFLVDVRMDVTLDGYPLYGGSFRSGMDLTVPVAPGMHSLVATINNGVIPRSKQYSLMAHPAHVCVATLDYSRFWGNFTSGLALRQHPC